MSLNSDLAKLIKREMEAADGNIDRAASALTSYVMTDTIYYTGHIAKLVNEAFKARISAEHGIDRNIILNNARDPSRPVSLATRRPIPVPNRISNSELQAEIDATLDIRILGDTKLRDCTRTDLFRSAEQDEKTAKTRQANAVWKRELGNKLKPGKTVEQSGFTGTTIRQIIRGHGGNLVAA